MDITYDICVDQDTLLSVGQKLKKIGENLHSSVTQMNSALQTSQDYLAGEQYEKVRRNTEECMEVAEKTENNLIFAMKYISELMDILDEYQECRYSGGRQ